MRVEQLRGSWVEVVHEVHVAVVDSTGGLVARTGDPELVTFWRSAAKPFQALPLVEDGAAARFGLTSEELALACASRSEEHTSELQSHSDLVCRLLLEKKKKSVVKQSESCQNETQTLIMTLSHCIQ